ncbi:MAG: flagellar biosynthesis/type III secretory pathway-like protein [Clostridium sp.]|uniref:FliH/SctL family protein n=1 Tax=Clostridium sp. TaxID=1506 RepID=UPI0025BA0AB2|nr:FliH/SctL family protein [Clostridium sp.]MCF0148154.1 flagellar biosynthesis/type III secretory pathway-like protein [Clostridium sp.]
MQSSYNLIKSQSALDASKKVIETNYTVKHVEGNQDNSYSIEDDFKKKYRILGANIIKKAKQEAEDIKRKSQIIAGEIEKKAYEDGYNQGKSNGYEDGYEDGYRQAIEKVTLETEKEVKEKIDKAENTLEKANKEYKEYLLNKEDEILKLAFDMASVIAKNELKHSEGILPLIESILEEAKGEENIIIRCNNIHIKSIKEKVNFYKQAYAIKGEIFILEDELMEAGNAIIDKGTGKATIGLDIALEKLENALFK